MAQVADGRRSAFLLVVEAATLSRSGLLGLGVGALVLAVPYRRYLRVARAARPDRRGARACCSRSSSRAGSFFTTVLKSRVQTSGGSENAHFQVYSFIPHVLHADPLFGLGLNTFSVYYEFVTGKTNWGPHSYYVALIVETGLVGTALFAVFIFWVFRRLGAARALGRALAAARDPLAARVRPLAWGCTAALAGTLASNAFYLTMQFYYFYAFMALALAVPVVFARAANEGRRPDDVVPARRRTTSPGSFVASAVEGVRALRRRRRGRLARVVPRLRHRLRRRHRAEPARRAVEARARAGVPRRVRARRASRGARRRPRARALDPVGDRRARDGQAVRAAGVGDGRRARASGARARAAAAARRAARDRGVDVPRRRGARARCARGARRSRSACRSRTRSPRRPSRRTSSSPAG